MAEYPIVWVYYILFIHSSVHRHLGCFPFLAFMNNATVNIRVRVWTYAFTLLGTPLAMELLGHMTDYSMFNIVSSFQTEVVVLFSTSVTWSGCIIFHSPPTAFKFRSLHILHQHLLLSFIYLFFNFSYEVVSSLIS